eukprot:GHVN01080030.1.p1 GENE.GHVN01080030.1~~GHVN01080030.1.p1  ORF type:complete len:192 (+),score=23.46 GHVN01080030.1:167-742(+)
MVNALAGGMGQQQQLTVAPPERLQAVGRNFTWLLVTQAVCGSVVMVLGDFWVLIVILSSLCGYWAVKNKEAYVPQTMLMFFNFNVMGTALGLASWAVTFSKVIGPRNPLSPDASSNVLPLLISWSVLLSVMVIVDRFAWILYKDMLYCPQSISGLMQQRGQPLPQGPPGLPSMQRSSDFSPFQGEGRRLGE